MATLATHEWDGSIIAMVYRAGESRCWLEVAEYESRRSAQVDTECAPDLPGEYRWHEKTNREWGHRDSAVYRAISGQSAPLFATYRGRDSPGASIAANKTLDYLTVSLAYCVLAINSL